jgi:hypothetical protein
LVIPQLVPHLHDCAIGLAILAKPGRFMGLGPVVPSGSKAKKHSQMDSGPPEPSTWG